MVMFGALFFALWIGGCRAEFHRVVRWDAGQNQCFAPIICVKLDLFMKKKQLRLRSAGHGDLLKPYARYTYSSHMGIIDAVDLDITRRRT